MRKVLSEFWSKAIMSSIYGAGGCALKTGDFWMDKTHVQNRGFVLTDAAQVSTADKSLILAQPALQSQNKKTLVGVVSVFSLSLS